MDVHDVVKLFTDDERLKDRKVGEYFKESYTESVIII